MRGLITPSVTGVLGGAFGARVVAEQATPRALRHGLQAAVLGFADLVNGLSRHVVLGAGELVEQAGGEVGGHCGTTSEQKQGGEGVAHGLNVAGALLWSLQHIVVRC